MNTEFDVVIVANGEFPTHEIPLGILKNAKHIVACDGAIKNVPQRPDQGYALLFVDEMAKNCVFGMHG